MSQPVVWGCEKVVSFGRERKEGGAVRVVAFGAALRGLSLASQSVRHLVSSNRLKSEAGANTVVVALTVGAPLA